MLPKPEIKKREDGWWVIIDMDDVDDIGPWVTKREAMGCKRDLLKFLRHENKFGFVTGEESCL